MEKRDTWKLTRARRKVKVDEFFFVFFFSPHLVSIVHVGALWQWDRGTWKTRRRQKFSPQLSTYPANLIRLRPEMGNQSGADEVGRSRAKVHQMNSFPSNYLNVSMFILIFLNCSWADSDFYSLCASHTRVRCNLLFTICSSSSLWKTLFFSPDWWSVGLTNVFFMNL